jgi:hypothetical protein
MSVPGRDVKVDNELHAVYYSIAELTTRRLIRREQAPQGFPETVEPLSPARLRVLDPPHRGIDKASGRGR